MGIWTYSHMGGGGYEDLWPYGSVWVCGLMTIWECVGMWTYGHMGEDGYMYVWPYMRSWVYGFKAI